MGACSFGVSSRHLERVQVARRRHMNWHNELRLFRASNRNSDTHRGRRENMSPIITKLDKAPDANKPPRAFESTGST